jgi:hypothetical protein
LFEGRFEATSNDKQNEFIEQTSKFDMDIDDFPWVCAQAAIIER